MTHPLDLSARWFAMACPGPLCVAIMLLAGVDAQAQEPVWRRALWVWNTVSIDADCADAQHCVAVFNTGLDQQIWRSVDGGNSWSQCYLDSMNDAGLPLKLFRVSHPSPNLIVVAADSGCIVRSVDSGATWQRLRVADADGAKSLSFSDERNGFVPFRGTGAPLVATSDGGESWTSIQLRRPSEWADTLYELPRDIIRLGADTLLVSIDGPGHIHALARSTDAGVSWSITCPFLPGYDTVLLSKPRLISSDGRTVLYAANKYYEYGFGFFVLGVSGDAGLTWNVRHHFTDQPEDILYTDFADSLHGLGVGWYGARRTTDGGVTWVMEDSTVNWASGLVFRRGHSGLAFDRGDGIVYLRSVVTTVEHQGESATALNITGSGSIRQIRFALTSPAVARTAVYDLRGDCVLKLPATVVHNGEQRIDLRSLAPGLYFIQTRVGSNGACFRVVVAD